MFQLPRQNRLIDQVVLYNQHMRPRPNDARLGRLRRGSHLPPLGRRSSANFGLRHVDIACSVPFLRLTRADADKEAESRAFTVLGYDLDAAAH